MAKVYPNHNNDNEELEIIDISSKRETLTMWMKSLVMQGNGCTVYNDNGEVVYRIDNYDDKDSDKVYLMDLKGKVLFTILRKKIWMFRKWEGYKSNINGLDLIIDKPLFQVTKNCSWVLNLGQEFSCDVAYDNNIEAASHYRLEGSSGTSALRITNGKGGLVAEAKRKLSSSGVVLGDDVLSLIIEASVDNALVMALVVAYGLVQRKI
uniref:Uncharacterized protein n=1 Tax=Cannabis sativa TaxID=3483 RepID=A0A803R4J6_CANSA